MREPRPTPDDAINGAIDRASQELGLTLTDWQWDLVYRCAGASKPVVFRRGRRAGYTTALRVLEKVLQEGQRGLVWDESSGGWVVPE